MHGGIAPFVGMPLQLLEDHARFRCNSVGLFIYLKQAVHALCIQNDTASHRQGAALAAEPPPCMHGSL